MSKKYSVYEMFEEYLRRTNLDVKRMPKVQFVETQRAFFGGISMFMDEMSKDFATEDDRVASVREASEDIRLFWASQAKRIINIS
jgi:hypothetical protein